MRPVPRDVHSAVQRGEAKDPVTPALPPTPNDTVAPAPENVLPGGERPAYWKAILLNVFGFGLFHAEPEARRKWVCAAVLPSIFLIDLVDSISYAYRFALSPINLILCIVWFVSFFDVVQTVTERRR